MNMPVLKLLRCSLAAGVYASTALGQTANTPEANILSVFRESIVMLRVSFRDANNPSMPTCDAGTGTGFIVSENGHVVTVAHLFEQPQSCSGQGTDQMVIEGRIGYSDGGEWLDLKRLRLPTDEYDIGLAKLPNSQVYSPVAPCVENNPVPGELYFIAGFPGGITLAPYPYTYFESNADLGYEIWLGGADAVPGVSGAPIIDNAIGRVVGIYQGKPQTTGNDLDFRGAIPLQVAEAAGVFSMAGLEVEECNADPVVDISCGQWLNAVEYRACFSQQVASDQFPESIATTVSEEGESLYRARWQPMPQKPGFCFMSCIDLTDERFAQLDQSLMAEGFQRQFVHRLGPSLEPGGNSATWTTSNYAFCQEFSQTYSCN
jgi:hypothetical protein